MIGCHAQTTLMLDFVNASWQHASQRSVTASFVKQCRCCRRMARPNLLLCFDAFGTLFRPKAPVAKQYAEVARQCGLSGFSDDELQSSLRAAIKEQAKLNPNYGKATGLGATKWWINVGFLPSSPLAVTLLPLVSLT